jgi:hypothetical protein
MSTSFHDSVGLPLSDLAIIHSVVADIKILNLNYSIIKVREHSHLPLSENLQKLRSLNPRDLELKIVLR